MLRSCLSLHLIVLMFCSVIHLDAVFAQEMDCLAPNSSLQDGQMAAVLDAAGISNASSSVSAYTDRVLERSREVTVYPRARRLINFIMWSSLIVVLASILTLIVVSEPTGIVKMLAIAFIIISIASIIISQAMYAIFKYKKHRGRWLFPIVFLAVFILALGIYASIVVVPLSGIAFYVIVLGGFMLYMSVVTYVEIDNIVTEFERTYNRTDSNKVKKVRDELDISQSSNFTPELNTFFNKKHVYEEQKRWAEVGAHWIRYSIPRIMKEYGKTTKETGAHIDHLKDLYANRLEKVIQQYDHKIAKDGHESLMPGSKEAEKLLRYPEEESVKRVIDEFYQDLKHVLKQKQNNYKTFEALLNRNMISKQLNHRMNLHRSRMIENQRKNGYSQVNAIVSSQMQSSSLPNFTQRNEGDMKMYTSGTFSVEKLTPKFLKHVLSPEELKLEMARYEKILSIPGFSKRLESQNTGSVKKWIEMLEKMKERMNNKKSVGLTESDYKTLAKMMTKVGRYHRVWELLKQFTQDEIEKNGVPEDQALSINFASVSLVTPDWARHYLGGTSERRMINNEMDAFKLFHGHDIEMNVDGNTVKIKPNINASVWPVNKYGQGTRSRLLRIWSHLHSDNKKAVQKMLADAGTYIGDLKQEIDGLKKGAEVNKQKLAEREARLKIINRLYTSLETAWRNQVFRKGHGTSMQGLESMMSKYSDHNFPKQSDVNYDPYMMPKLMMHLGYYLNYHLSGHCKSGKDRSGELWSQVMLERMYQRENPEKEVIGAYNRLPSAGMKKMIAEKYHQTGNPFNQMMQTGLVGAKIQSAPLSVKVRYGNDGNEDVFKNVAGYSGFVRSLFAVEVEPTAWTEEGTGQSALRDTLKEDDHSDFYKKVRSVIEQLNVDDVPLNVDEIMNRIYVVSSTSGALKGARYVKAKNTGKLGAILISQNEIDKYKEVEGSAKKGAIAWLAHAVIGHEFLHMRYDAQNLTGSEMSEEAYVVAESLNQQSLEDQKLIGTYMQAHADALVGRHEDNRHRAAMKVLKDMRFGDNLRKVTEQEVLDVMIGAEGRAQIETMLAKTHVSAEDPSKEMVDILVAVLTQMNETGRMGSTPISISMDAILKQNEPHEATEEISALLILKAIDIYNQKEGVTGISVEIDLSGRTQELVDFFNDSLMSSDLRWKVPVEWFKGVNSGLATAIKIQNTQNWSSWFQAIGQTSTGIDVFVGFENPVAAKEEVTQYLNDLASKISISA